ncbi:MAG: anti-sigma factor [Planctomycetota bacterium]
MTQSPAERIEELLADRAVFGLSAAEAREFDALVEEHPQKASEEPGFEDTVLALMKTAPAVDMPASLRNRLDQAAQAHASDSTPEPGADVLAGPSVFAGSERSAVLAYVGWMAAAAAFALAAVAWFNVSTSPGTAPGMAPGTAAGTASNTPGGDVSQAELDPAEQAQTLAQQPGTVVLPWAQFDDEFQGVAGDVVWNNDQQRGYMRLTGMRVNDPAEAQYQLWIVDPARDSRPVDGGVFDVTDEGDVVVAFEPRLPVDRPVAFAITREKPGGVVKSDGPLRVIAPAAAG